MSWRNKDDRIQLVSNIDLFKDFSKEILESISNSFLFKQLEAKEVLIKQGDDGESLFILVEGLLDVSLTVGEENRHLTMLRPGAFLGEMALLTGEKRSANVTTAAASLVVELTKDSIMSLATTNPEVLEKMTSAVAKRRLKNKEMEALSDEDKNEAIQNEEKNLMAKVTNFFFGS